MPLSSIDLDMRLVALLCFAPCRRYFFTLIFTGPTGGGFQRAPG